MLDEAQELEHDDEDGDDELGEKDSDEEEAEPAERWVCGSEQASWDRMKRRCGSSHESSQASRARWKMERGGVTTPLRRDRRCGGWWWGGPPATAWWGPGGKPRGW